MNDSQFRQLMSRLDTLEQKIDHANNPALSVSVDEKADIMLKALATGDKKKIKAASKQINGR